MKRSLHLNSHYIKNDLSFNDQCQTIVKVKLRTVSLTLLLFRAEKCNDNDRIKYSCTCKPVLFYKCMSHYLLKIIISNRRWRYTSWTYNYKSVIKKGKWERRKEMRVLQDILLHV
ncbi:uncharacterized protein LOC143427272 [Xylocopa sonorina]|uniref:uncharacterized protein LOC143427272 n=1 Tax=Xylocopa sonorina TaxID=1818115 RepID=UPI00403ACB5B